jgi:carboxyl-terminal processing protease|tara:strand:+ start:5619 stop:6827 length:1209 start_codon:yes stop_codon:yes gene_type:complete
MTKKHRSLLAILTGVFLGFVLSLSNEFFSSFATTRFNLNTNDEILTTIKEKYIETVDFIDFEQQSIEKTIAQLDEYSEFLSEQEYQDIINVSKGIYTGVGIKIYEDEAAIKVSKVFSNSPADYAGIMLDDEIVKINAKEITFNEFIKTLKTLEDNKKSEIEIIIHREGINEELNFKMLRENVSVPSIYAEIMTSNYCYIKIDVFNNNTKIEINDVLSDECAIIDANQNQIQGVIIDVRNNPGGTLKAAVGVSDLFLNKGVIVSARGRDNKLMFTYSANQDDIADGLPMVIIVNKKSASAAEIFAGAMQDNNRAIVVGVNTYGKGSIQEVIPLSKGGAIILTTARYYRPSGNPITSSGIRPDVKIVDYNYFKDSKYNSRVDLKQDVQLSQAIDILKRNKDYYQ